MTSAADQLPDATRKALEHYAAGRTTGEIAALVGGTDAGVSRLLEHAGVASRAQAKALLAADETARRNHTEAAEVLLARTRHHANKRIARLAEQTAAKLTELRETLTAYDRDRAARDKVARLEAELAEARKALGGTTKPPSGKSRTPQIVRAWARAAGVDCPTHGRVPAHVMDAYRAAHPGATA